MVVDEVTQQRIVLSKLMLNHALSHVSEDSIISRIIIIHNLDNAVEFLLRCIATHCGAVEYVRQDFGLKQLIDSIEKKGLSIPLRQQILNLRDVRNSAQHQGEIPAKESIIKYKGYVEDFFIEALQEIFQLDYYKIYMSMLIEDDETREILINAEKLLNNEKYSDSIILIGKAFGISMRKEEKKVGKEYLSIDDYLPSEVPFDDVNVENLKDAVSDNILKLKWISFGIEMRRWFEIQKIVPISSFIVSYTKEFGKDRYIETIKELEDAWFEKNPPTKNKALFCLNFVIETILYWQKLPEFDFNSFEL